MRSFHYVIAVLLAGGIGGGSVQQARGAGLPACPDTGVITQSCQMTKKPMRPLSIAAHNVILECNGHVNAIEPAPKESPAVGIDVISKENVQLRNCFVMKFDKGIRIVASRNVSIFNPLVNYNRIGIEIRGTTGFVRVQGEGGLHFNEFGIDARGAENVLLRGSAPPGDWLRIDDNHYGARFRDINQLEVQRVHFFGSNEVGMAYVWLNPTPPEGVSGGAAPRFRDTVFTANKVGLMILTEHNTPVHLEDTVECVQNTVDVQHYDNRPAPTGGAVGRWACDNIQTVAD